MEDKALTEPGFVFCFVLFLLVRAVLFPSLFPTQAASSVLECPKAPVISPDCFMHLSVKGKKKGGGERNRPRAASWAKGFLFIID